MTEPDLSRQIDRRMRLAREWDELVEQVRALDGFEDFLRPPRIERLRDAAVGGPVVIVNVSRWRCDALIVRAGMEVTSVELSELTLDAVTERVNAYLTALHDDQSAHVAMVDAADEELAGRLSRAELLAATQAYLRVNAATEAHLTGLLAWMWDVITEPVLTALGLDEPTPDGQDPPRLWWCPTGALTLLPLHAAGHHDRPGASVIDRVVSSYTPTLRALMEARSRSTSAPAGEVRDSMAVVALSETPRQPVLPNVTREVELLQRLLPDRLELLSGEDATVAAVLETMTARRWAHFSCHGDQNLAMPSQGGLLLYDGLLSITDITARQYHGDFAFLSACKTATGGVDLPDEAITLAAALHYTGYNHVVATLWSVWDRGAADVTESVYEQIVQDGRVEPQRSATALHHAVVRLRRRNLDRPSVWTPFIHIGP
ncbi:CHAT domain-containing protein [Actinoplanes xinjiangensis]|uniref:CHAT domain-containing protein n=1 Tax=Actinoplanes xinjiangensis TaxID=512350 RepID=UPI00342D4D4E